MFDLFCLLIVCVYYCFCWFVLLALVLVVLELPDLIVLIYWLGLSDYFGVLFLCLYGGLVNLDLGVWLVLFVVCLCLLLLFLICGVRDNLCIRLFEFGVVALLTVFGYCCLFVVLCRWLLLAVWFRFVLVG